MPCRRGEAGRQGLQCCSHPYACHTSTAEPPIALPHQQPQSITARILFSNPLALSLLLGSSHDGMRRPIDGRRIIPCCCRLSLRLRARRVAATAAATAALAAGPCCDGKAEGPGGFARFGHALTGSCGGIVGAAFLATRVAAPSLHLPPCEHGNQGPAAAREVVGDPGKLVRGKVRLSWRRCRRRRRPAADGPPYQAAESIAAEGSMSPAGRQRQGASS